MKYTLYLTLLLFISCKTKVSENFNDITLKPTQKELINIINTISKESEILKKL